LNIVRALLIAGIPIVLFTACDRQARGEQFSGTDSGSARETGPQWPAGPSPSAQFDTLVEGPSAPGPQAGTEKGRGEATPGPAPSTEPADDEGRTRLNAYWDYGAVLESADKAFRLHVGGCFEFDNTWYRQTQTLPFLLQDGADMRRARLRADGTMGENVDFVTEVNFANIQDVSNESTQTNIGSVGLDDFDVTFKQVPVVENVRLGHFKQPIGLEHSTGANAQYYMERSDGHDAFFQPFEYVTGIMFFNTFWDDRATAALSLARVGKETVSPFAFGAGPGECAATGRVTLLPIYEDKGQRLLHLGIGYSYSGTDNNNFEGANRPLVRAGAGSQQVPNIIQTGSYYTPDPVQIVNAEFATVLGRFSASAEYQFVRGTNVFDQYNNGVFSGPHGNVTYQGFYAEAGFFLNADDYRRYDKKDATWDRQLQGESSVARMRSPWVFADHTPVQLLCRYSYLDLASGNPILTPSSGTQAGWEHDITAGVDWYINPEVHFMVNYVYTRLDYVNNTSGDINGLGCRVHVDF
jgi:phosphate-selective porin OprO/OprP